MSAIEYRQRLARRAIPKDFPNGISLERWLTETTQTETPKLTEP